MAMALPSDVMASVRPCRSAFIRSKTFLVTSSLTLSCLMPSVLISMPYSARTGPLRSASISSWILSNWILAGSLLTNSPNECWPMTRFCVSLMWLRSLLSALPSVLTALRNFSGSATRQTT